MCAYGVPPQAQPNLCASRITISSESLAYRCVVSIDEGPRLLLQCGKASALHQPLTGERVPHLVNVEPLDAGQPPYERRERSRRTARERHQTTYPRPNLRQQLRGQRNAPHLRDFVR